MSEAYRYPKHFDVLVCGAGHAGVEAAHAAAKLGCRTLMLTQNLDTIAQMSCNPAIGGLAKGHMVREIDAMGGVMAENTDATGIQFRLLNRRKGPSVQAPRAQCDKKAYQFRMKAILEDTQNLELQQGNVLRLLRNENGVCGVETTLGVIYKARTVVVTTGTFMRGLLHVGLRNQSGGRMGDGISTLSDSLKELGLEIGRFKTGTPCRIHGKSIRFDQMERQDGDLPPPRFSNLNRLRTFQGLSEVHTLNRLDGNVFHVEQFPCWLTWTNEHTHDVIRANLDKSPMYCGRIEGVGPRYCPSIEDKVVRFAEKERHQVFLEPEGRHTHEYYVNGVSTSLPFEVQLAFIRSIQGLADAQILRAGYAVEYDYCPPTQLSATLETKCLPNLYLAGQINGTSGYEEAAAQGLMAGINAARKCQNKPEVVLSRDQAYIGVLIDDLVTRGTLEPYRMFTSRAEHRLLLRQDNADQRLTPLAHALGMIGQEQWSDFQSRESQRKMARESSRTQSIEGIKLQQWLKQPQNQIDMLPTELLQAIPLSIWQGVETDLKYEGYIKRQQLEQIRLIKNESTMIPNDFNYGAVRGLRNEARQKLASAQPRTLGQAGRISGITPADLSLLNVWLHKSACERA
ncbi:MAG: tRNA uridine-5-carboxymethylaminomethyl(34) synthesis enzyme MnmG [Verrucomicrobiales bacterium]